MLLLERTLEHSPVVLKSSISIFPLQKTQLEKHLSNPILWPNRKGNRRGEALTVHDHTASW